MKIPRKYRRLISERKKTALFSRSMAQTGCQFVVDSPSLFGQEASDEMLRSSASAMWPTERELT